MTEVKAELLARDERLRRDTGEDAAPQVAAERQRIGRQLHRTILQDLTVAGLSLKSLQDMAPQSAAAIGEFAAWLRTRQSELRRVVAELEQGRRGDSGSDLAAIAADLHDRYGCEVTVDPQLGLDRVEPQIWSAMTDTVQGVAQILAEDLSARRIDLAPAGAAQPSLKLSHDGRMLAGTAELLAAVRRVVGRNGASLQIRSHEAIEQLILDWAS